MASYPKEGYEPEKHIIAIQKGLSNKESLERGFICMQTFNFRGEVTLSRLGMGAMRLPMKEEAGSPIDVEKAQEIIDYAVKNGVNYFDTAYVYHEGKSEEFLGKALSKYPRDSFYVADKFNYMANPDYKAQFAEQLDRLQMDRIDFYLLHAVSDDLMDQLLSCGIKPENISAARCCTCCDEDNFFSHRRGRGRSGIMLAVIDMRGAEEKSKK